MTTQNMFDNGLRCKGKGFNCKGCEDKNKCVEYTEYVPDMVEQKYYDVVLSALTLACDMLSRSNIEVTKDNMEMLEYKMHGSLKGYFLMKAEEMLSNRKAFE